MKAQSELAATLREQKEILKQWQDVAGDWAAALSEMVGLNNRIAEVLKKGNGSNLFSTEFVSLREKTVEAEHKLSAASNCYSEIAAKGHSALMPQRNFSSYPSWARLQAVSDTAPPSP